MKHLLLAASLLATAVPALGQPAPQDFRARLPQDEVIYFLLPDRFENGDTRNDKGALKGDRLATGFDPTHKGFFHGGDLKGLTKRLDYIQGLGATAIWLAPIFKNKPVQGAPGQESAGYHGYWVTDFTQVDPHFGSNDDFKAFVEAAHARGMKVYMDIIANHTADVIKYRECIPDKPCAYRSRADYPYQRRGGPNGAAINPGFSGDGVQTTENFAKLTDPTYAYTPYVPKGEEREKVPAWLNDVTLYHNRGDSAWKGESNTLGDFAGLDDLMTEHPRVVAGMIDVFGSWIDRFKIDGFRIDTARHVNPEFWQAFVPAMQARAKANGIPNFHIFGEVFDADPAVLAMHTRVDKLPTVLDFAFAYGVIDVVANGSVGPAKLARIFAADANFEGGQATANRLPTFLGNHDMGRFSGFVREKRPKAGDAEVLQRVLLAHAMMMTLRGAPTIYYGDEQGFVSDGGDQDAREDMFASKVAVYNDNRLLGTTATTAQANFDTRHPLYAALAELAKVRAAEPALRRGTTVVRFADDKPGLLAVSRMHDGREVLVAFNTSTEAITANVQVEPGSMRFKRLAGVCPNAASAPGSVRVTIPALSWAVCAAEPAQ